MVAPTKTRRADISPFGITETIRIGGSIISVKDLKGRFVDLEETYSEGHAWPPKKGSSLRIDRGGPFENRKCRILSMYTPRIDVTIQGGPWNGSTLIGTLGSAHWPVLPTLLAYGSDTVLQGLGSTAISRCSPLKSQAQLGTALGELKDGFPRLIGAAFLKKESKFFRDLGSEYLNVEFGWKPFINDLISSVKALGKASAILSQLARDSGKPVRRGYEFPLEKTVTSDPGQTDYGRPSSIGAFYTSPGLSFKTVTNSRRVWFSGEFMYHLPAGSDFPSKARRWQTQAHRLIGLRLDPELLWNLAPWTWLADWFGNVGDVVSNSSAYLFDGLVMKYGYIMEHVSEVSQYDTIGIKFSNGTTASPRATFLRETKRRIGATPFGFGLDPATFSAWQASILAALGLSRRA